MFDVIYPRRRGPFLRWLTIHWHENWRVVSDNWSMNHVATTTLNGYREDWQGFFVTVSVIGASCTRLTTRHLKCWFFQ